MIHSLKFFLFIFNLILSAQAAGSTSILSDEQVTLQKARNLFTEKKYEQAIQTYDRIPTKSDRWLIAVEEKSWAHLQLKQFDKALALAYTLTTPALNPMTSTEVYLLRALIELKLCDYQAVFRTLQQFKQQKREQVVAIQTLVKTGQNTISKKALEEWMKDSSQWKQIGPMLGQLPQLFFKDKKMIELAHQKNLAGMEKRLQELAKLDQNENYRILQKLNLVEIEAIQRAHIQTKLAGKQGEKDTHSTEELVFKYDNDEQWLDEINNYETAVDRCEKKSGRTM